MKADSILIRYTRRGQDARTCIHLKHLIVNLCTSYITESAVKDLTEDFPWTKKIN
ncbi:MAG: hypothetical protein F6K17_15855 [Okeania sp. SIO3C4]|nr:hypothetical protein [Okeania sp. SIO3B3]NER03981.1 hypothetical protein [Okeania sp. SIO3C4]